MGPRNASLVPAPQMSFYLHLCPYLNRVEVKSPVPDKIGKKIKNECIILEKKIHQNDININIYNNNRTRNKKLNNILYYVPKHIDKYIFYLLNYI